MTQQVYSKVFNRRSKTSFNSNSRNNINEWISTRKIKRGTGRQTPEFWWSGDPLGGKGQGEHSALYTTNGYISKPTWEARHRKIYFLLVFLWSFRKGRANIWWKIRKVVPWNGGYDRLGRGTWELCHDRKVLDLHRSAGSPGVCIIETHWTVTLNISAFHHMENTHHFFSLEEKIINQSL